MLNLSTILDDAIAEHLAVIGSLSSQKTILQRIAMEMTRTVLAGNKILWCGNGGSAADAQHLAAELVGRFKRERPGIPSLAITTDTSVLTAIANDYGYDQVFSRQVETLCRAGDLLVGISTSGNSRNICAALQTAVDIGAFTVVFTGQAGGSAAKIADIALQIQGSDTARIQEAHILCGHILCDCVEACFAERHGALRGFGSE